MSLSLSYSEIRDAIGRTMGWGSTYSDWSTSAAEVADADRIIKSGLRRFYYPLIPDGGGTHVWSFMTPSATLQLTAGSNTFQLPHDFVSVKRSFTFQAGTEAFRTTAKSEAQLVELIRQEDKSGVPEFYAIRARSTEGDDEPGYEVLFYPRPDLAYEMTYRYQLSPPELSTANPYHLGGPQHSETVLSAVLSSAEKFVNDEEQVHSEQFPVLLAASVALDREVADGDGEDIWDSTADGSLRVTLPYLRKIVGREMQHGAHPGLWSRRQFEEIELAIESGLRRFYYPPAVIEDRPRHVWSFLTPTHQFQVAASQEEYVLPDDFNDLASEIVSFVGESTTSAVRVSEEAIRSLRAQSSRTGSPKYVAVRARQTDAGETTQYELMMYPTPEKAYTLEMRYLITPPQLSDENEIPLGSGQHAETILEACLAASENVMNIKEGDHETRFRDLLTQSVLSDVALAEPPNSEIWPFENEAEGLSVNKAYLKRMIGRTMKFGPHPTLWSHSQQQQVDTACEAGLRKFYNPPVLPGEKYGHEWTFLRPLATISLIGSEMDYDLPKDFSMFHGPLTFAPEVSALYPPIEIVGEEQVRRRRQAYSSSGRPAIAAVAPKRVTEDGKTEYVLMLYPTPDGTYDLNYRYQINPVGLSDDVALPIGGQAHAQTVLYACLSAAEEMLGIGEGMNTRKFSERIRTSVGHDRKVNAPDTMGYGYDQGNRDEQILDSWHEYDENIVTYRGYSI